MLITLKHLHGTIKYNCTSEQLCFTVLQLRKRRQQSQVRIFYMLFLTLSSSKYINSKKEIIQLCPYKTQHPPPTPKDICKEYQYQQQFHYIFSTKVFVLILAVRMNRLVLHPQTNQNTIYGFPGR